MKDKTELLLIALLIIAVGTVSYNIGAGVNNDPRAEEVPADFFSTLDEQWDVPQDFEVPIIELRLIIAASEDAGQDYVRTTAVYNKETEGLMIGYKPVGKLKVALELFPLCPPYCDDDNLTVKR